MTRSPSGGGDGARGRRITASPTNDTDFLDPSPRPASYHVSYCSCDKRNLEKQYIKKERNTVDSRRISAVRSTNWPISV